MDPVVDPVVDPVGLPSGPALVQLSGDLDLAIVPALRAGLGDALRASSEVLVDLSRVTFVEASVIGTLVQARQQAVARHGDLWLVGAGPGVTRILQIAGLTETLRSLPEGTGDFSHRMTLPRPTLPRGTAGTAPGQGHSDDY